MFAIPLKSQFSMRSGQPCVFFGQFAITVNQFNQTADCLVNRFNFFVCLLAHGFQVFFLCLVFRAVNPILLFLDLCLCLLQCPLGCLQLDLGVVICPIIEKLMPSAARLRGLAHECDLLCRFSVGVDVHEDMAPALSLSTEDVKHIAELGADLDIDVIIAE